MNDSLFYKDKPIFGLDIGFDSLKVMQTVPHNKQRVITGYGYASFDSKALAEGVIVDPEIIAQSLHMLFERHLIGDISTRRVAMSVPASRTYNRNVQLPKMGHKELDEAVRLEAEQYIPIPAADLYIDYDVIRQTANETELLVVAVPRKIIDSYITLARLAGLEVVAIETTIGACSRLFVQTSSSDVPTILIDFGSVSTDITIYDRTLVVTGTVAGGGDNFTTLIADRLKVTTEEAHVIKTKYGLGVSKKQAEINEAISPVLDSLLKEIRRMIRYYDERSDANRKITQVVTMGGGANMPGLSDYMTNKLRLPVRMCHPWSDLGFARLQPPSNTEKSMYVTVAGLSLLNPKEVFA